MTALRSATLLVSLLSACYTLVESIPYTSSLFDYGTSRPYPPVVQEFASCFTEKIISSKYSKAFAVKHLPIDEFTEIIRTIVYDPHEAIGSADPEFLAIAASQAARSSFDVATPLFVAEVFAFTAGEHLFQRRVLNLKNVEKLSKQLLRSITKELDALEDFSCALSNFNAIRDGLLNFVASLGFFTKDNSFTFAGTFTEVWLVNRL